MKLQKATCFALFAVIELAADPTRSLAAAEIAEKYDISLHHLAKVLRDLDRAGIVHAVRGSGGGYRFASNPKRLTLMDVIAIFEPIETDTFSDGEPNPVTDVGRALRTVLKEIDEHAIATFRSITISTMMKSSANSSGRFGRPKQDREVWRERIEASGGSDIDLVKRRLGLGVHGFV